MRKNETVNQDLHNSNMQITATSIRKLLAEAILVDAAVYTAPFIYFLTYDAQAQTYHALSKEEVAANIRNNLNLLIDKHRTSFQSLASSIRVSEIAIEGISKGFNANPNAYIVYRIAHYFNYDLNTFITSTPDQLEKIKPILSKLEAPLSAQEFQSNYADNFTSVTKQKKISISKDGKAWSPIENKYVGVHDLHWVAQTLDTDINRLVNKQMTPANVSSEKKPAEIKKMRFTHAAENIVSLAKSRSIVLEELAKSIGIPPSGLIRFVSGSFSDLHSIRQLLYNVAVHFECSIDDVIASPEEFQRIQKSTINFSKQSTIEIRQNYNKNLSQAMEKVGISLDGLSKKLGYPASAIESGENIIVAQDVARALGQELHTLLSPIIKLPEPNLSLTSKITTKLITGTTKLGIIGAVGVLSILPAVALDTSVEIASDEFEKHGKFLLNTNLPSNHPFNAFTQMGISASEVALGFAKLILGKDIIDGAIKGAFTTRPENELIGRTGLIDKLIDLPLDVMDGAIKGYFKGAQPIVNHSQEFFKALYNLVENVALQVYENAISTDYAKNLEAVQQVILQISNVASDIGQRILNFSSDVKQDISNRMMQIVLNDFQKLVVEHHNEGLALLKKNDVKGAINKFSRAIELNKNFHPAYTQRGCAYLTLKNYPQSIADLERARQLDPKNYGIYYHLSLAYYNSNQFQKASENITEALKLLPNNATYLAVQKELDPQTHHNEGLALFKKNDIRGAINKFSRAIELKNNYHPAYTQRGCCHLYLKNYTQSVLDLEYARTLDPKNYGIYYHLAWAYSELGQLQKASENIAEALTLLPNNATYLATQNNIKKKLTELDPQNHHNEGLALLKKNDVAGAINKFSRAIELNKNFHPAYTQRGCCHLTLKNYPQSSADLERARQLDPKNYGIYYHLSLAYYNSNQFQKASENITEALKLLPNNGSYLNLQKMIDQKLQIQNKPKSRLIPGGEEYVRDALSRYRANGYWLTVNEIEAYFQDLFKYQCFENIYVNEYQWLIQSSLPSRMYDLLSYRAQYLQRTLPPQITPPVHTVYRQITHQPIFQGTQPPVQKNQQSHQSSVTTAPNSSHFKPAPSPCPPGTFLSGDGKACLAIGITFEGNGKK